MKSLVRRFNSSLSGPTFVVAAAFYIIFILRTGFQVHGEWYFSLFDDAMISMRYAQNLANGFGLLWNQGAAPVEGYTNFLWTLCMAVAHVLPLPESMVSLVIMLTSAACLILNLVVVKKIAENISGNIPFVVRSSVVLTAFYYPLVYWSLRGMEVGLLALLTDVAVLLSFQVMDRYSKGKMFLLAAVGSLMLLTRTDAMLPIAIIVAFTTWKTDAQRKMQSVIMTASILLLTVSLHTLFRYVYYGDILPNTYYLKLTGFSTLWRVLEGSTAFAKLFLFQLWFVLIIVFVLIAYGRKQILNAKSSMLFFLFLCQCGYSIYVGGDAFEQLHFTNRFISIALPSLFVFISYAFFQTNVWSRRDAMLSLGGMAASTAVIGLGVLISNRESVPGVFEMYGRQYLAFVVIYVAIVIILTLAGTRIFREWPQLKTAHFSFRSLAVIIVFLSLNGPSFVEWLARNATYVDYDSTMAKLGLEIRRSTPVWARIAVVWAGAPPYYSQRYSIDLLGKNDPVIAKEAPHGTFKPGHNKWDYRYSIGSCLPDIVLQTFRLNKDDREYLDQLGYKRLSNDMYVNMKKQGLDSSVLEKIKPNMVHLYEEK